MYFLGIDIGSLSCGAVLVEDRGERRCLRGGQEPEGDPGRVTNEVFRGSGIDRAAVTEITCHARERCLKA